MEEETFKLEIEGQISEIIYQNEVNGYMVAEFETKEETTVIVGYLPFINNGDSLKATRKIHNSSRLWKTI